MLLTAIFAGFIYYAGRMLFGEPAPGTIRGEVSYLAVGVMALLAVIILVTGLFIPGTDERRDHEHRVHIHGRQSMTTLKDVLSEVSALPEIISMEIEGNHLEIVVESDALTPVSSFVFKKFGASLVTMHAADFKEDGFRLYVIFSLDKDDLFVTVTSRVDDNGIYRSLTPAIYAADWYEREILDMFGLTPLGHPDLRPLVLYDDWPQGLYPLRKDFSLSTKVPRVPSEYHFKRVEGEGVFEIPVGPVHAGVIEPGHFRFSVAGEPVINLELRLGYTHKGIEKISEGMPYAKGVYLSERISGDSGVAHSTAYCQAIEKAAGVKIPERAEYLRTVFLEMERIYNHLGDVGGIALDTAFSVAASHAFILKEKMLQVNECVTGSRLLRSVNRIGGVRKDISRRERDEDTRSPDQDEAGPERSRKPDRQHSFVPRPGGGHRQASAGRREEP